MWLKQKYLLAEKRKREGNKVVETGLDAKKVLGVVLVAQGRKRSRCTATLLVVQALGYDAGH